MPSEKPEQKIANGSVVRLKSGGPLMTASKFDDYNSDGWSYFCVWFDHNDTRRSDTFLESDIEIVNRDN